MYYPLPRAERVHPHPTPTSHFPPAQTQERVQLQAPGPWLLRQPFRSTHRREVRRAQAGRDRDAVASLQALFTPRGSPSPWRCLPCLPVGPALCLSSPPCFSECSALQSWRCTKAPLPKSLEALVDAHGQRGVLPISSGPGPRSTATAWGPGCAPASSATLSSFFLSSLPRRSDSVKGTVVSYCQAHQDFTCRSERRENFTWHL